MHDRPGVRGNGEESGRDIGSDDRRPEVTHHLTFTTAEVDRGASRADDQVVDEREQISGVAGVVANRVDPPLCNAVPGLVHSPRIAELAVDARERVQDDAGAAASSANTLIDAVVSPLSVEPVAGVGASGDLEDLVDVGLVETSRDHVDRNLPIRHRSARVRLEVVHPARCALLAVVRTDDGDIGTERCAHERHRAWLPDLAPVVVNMSTGSPAVRLAAVTRPLLTLKSVLSIGYRMRWAVQAPGRLAATFCVTRCTTFDGFDCVAEFSPGESHCRPPFPALSIGPYHRPARNSLEPLERFSGGDSRWWRRRRRPPAAQR